MATLDRRTLDLVETLIAARLDWLAFELVDAVERGRASTEDPDTLAAVRQKVRKDDQPRATGEPKLLSREPQPIEGDDQIDWAARYVAERLNSTLYYLMQSIENLDAIAGDNTEAPSVMPEKAGELFVVLIDGEDYRQVGRASVDAAIGALSQLRSSLEAWSTQARGKARL